MNQVLSHTVLLKDIKKRNTLKYQVFIECYDRGKTFQFAESFLQFFLAHVDCIQVVRMKKPKVHFERVSFGTPEH